MNALLYAYDQQVDAVIAQRQLQARKAAQIRLAKGEMNPGVMLAGRARNAIGRMLIAVGERLHADARPVTEIDITPASAVRRA